MKAIFLPPHRHRHTGIPTDSGALVRRFAARETIQNLAAASLGLFLTLLAACSTAPVTIRDTPPYAYSVIDDGNPAAVHAPVFVPQDFSASHNRIGTPSARRDEEGKISVYVDPARPTVYLQQQAFATARGKFINYIYRVHLPEVPLSWIPFHLTAGPNGGLIVVVTVDESDRAVLITTVHTCGCYLALVPTQLYPEDALPRDWPTDIQTVYGERLPARITLSATPGSGERLTFWLRDGTHRVMHLEPVEAEALASTYQVIPMAMRNEGELLELPLPDGGTTSFFYGEGRKRGYVKNTRKPFELLLMSWWALDLNVGVDKRLGPADEVGTVFYTSLRPWARKQSDLWNFPAFLHFWGFSL